MAPRRPWLAAAGLGVAMISAATLEGAAAALPLLRAQIDALDLAKLLALALFVGASLPLAGGGPLPRWLGRAGVLLAPTLVDSNFCS